LNFTKGGIAKDGIDYLVKKFNENNYQLLYLDLSDNFLMDQDVENLPNLKSLKELYAMNNYFTEASMNRFTHLDYLEYKENEERFDFEKRIWYTPIMADQFL
jgi:Leucine-rich repeat (LRR) protein